MKDMKCSKCGFPIIVGMHYMKHDDGTILCEDCFKKMVKSGEIE